MFHETVHGPVHAVAEWLRANGIDPQDVPIDSDITIGTEPFGGARHIRYSALLRNELGHLHHDPATGRAAVEARTALLVVEAPENVKIAEESRAVATR
ncbi:hypothetical protein [Streptomyces sp. NPDC006285]|uniref:hypothetical protein n=1 Tax=Streptomyces sp. NPDC006285 TaxID=3364742 RepID=UPI0036905694